MAHWTPFTYSNPSCPSPSLNFSQTRCISLACYPIHDTGPQAIEILRPIPWKEIPPVLSFLMNDELTFDFPHELRCVSITFSEYKPLTTILVKASECYFLDISRYIQLGQNRLCFSQVDSISNYLFVLYSHYPTESQLRPLRARWP